MKQFSIAMTDFGQVDVKVTITSSYPVEFIGAEAIVDTKSAIYRPNTQVRFRLAGEEPTEWFIVKAQRTPTELAKLDSAFVKGI
jgi:hypothetical protein